MLRRWRHSLQFRAVSIALVGALIVFLVTGSFLSHQISERLFNDTLGQALSQSEADFPQRLGYTAFFPLPESAFDDMDAFGESPISTGPYKLAEWNHNQDATIVPNENYTGGRTPKNDGVKFVFYPTQDSAYSDLLGGNLDVLDAIPDSAFAT